MNLAVLTILFALLAIVTQAQRYQVNTYTIYSPDGGIEGCSMCDGQSGQYTCSDNRFGNWNGGVFNFRDSFGYIPSGMQVRVTSYNVTVYGTFGCSASGTNSNIQMSLNGVFLNSITPSKSPSTCACDACDAPIVSGALSDTFYRYGLPNYNLNGQNSLVLSPSVNYICLQRIEVSINYTINSKFSQTTYLNIPFNNTTLGKFVCGSDKGLITNYGPTYTNINFNDPLPAKAVLVRVRAKVYGGFNCASYSGVTYTLTLQNMKLVTISNPTNSCQGLSFCTMNNFYSEQAYVSGWPDYVYGGVNSLKWVQGSYSSDYSQISMIQLALDYYTTP